MLTWIVTHCWSKVGMLVLRPRGEACLPGQSWSHTEMLRELRMHVWNATTALRVVLHLEALRHLCALRCSVCADTTNLTIDLAAPKCRLDHVKQGICEPVTLPHPLAGLLSSWTYIPAKQREVSVISDLHCGHWESILPGHHSQF